VKSQMGQWCVGSPGPAGIISSPLEQFNTQAEADLGLQIIQYYGMNSRCTVGKMPYYLTDRKAPFNDTALGGQQMEHFDPDQIEVKKRFKGPKGIKWVIAQGDKDIIDFQTSQGDAMRMYHVIQKYGFGCYCWLGARNNPSMQYFLWHHIVPAVSISLPGKSPGLRAPHR
jgi:hypothetical protein